MFPILVRMYVHPDRQEEREAFSEFGEAYKKYAHRVPALVPRLAGWRREVMR
jgi:protein-S-isoprenylcysteine O-methyltransferase Ste14